MKTTRGKLREVRVGVGKASMNFSMNFPGIPFGCNAAKSIHWLPIDYHTAARRCIYMVDLEEHYRVNDFDEIHSTHCSVFVLGERQQDLSLSVVAVVNIRLDVLLRVQYHRTVTRINTRRLERLDQRQ